MPAVEHGPIRDQPWVAIIDDDESVRVSISRLFRAHGIPAQPFGSAEEFLHCAADKLPQCILLDVQLVGGLSGPDLQERLSAEGAAPPIIFMTGQDEIKPAQLARFPELRFSLRKPFDTERLIARIRSVLDNSSVPTS
jgi:FixJ family two-component response regulator